MLMRYEKKLAAEWLLLLLNAFGYDSPSFGLKRESILLAFPVYYHLVYLYS